MKFNINGRVKEAKDSYLLPEHELGTSDVEGFLRARGINDKDPFYKTHAKPWLQIRQDADWFVISILDKESAARVDDNHNKRLWGLRFSILVRKGSRVSMSGLVGVLWEFRDWSMQHLQGNENFQVDPEEWVNQRKKWESVVFTNADTDIRSDNDPQGGLKDHFESGSSILVRDNTAGYAFGLQDKKNLPELGRWLEKLGNEDSLSLFPMTDAGISPDGRKPGELPGFTSETLIQLFGKAEPPPYRPGPEPIPPVPEPNWKSTIVASAVLFSLFVAAVGGWYFWPSSEVRKEKSVGPVTIADTTTTSLPAEEELAEEPAEVPVEESAEEPAEEPIEESAEEPAEEPIEESAEEPEEELGHGVVNPSHAENSQANENGPSQEVASQPSERLKHPEVKKWLDFYKVALKNPDEPPTLVEVMDSIKKGNSSLYFTTENMCNASWILILLAHESSSRTKEFVNAYDAVFRGENKNGRGRAMKDLKAIMYSEPCDCEITGEDELLLKLQQDICNRE